MHYILVEDRVGLRKYVLGRNYKLAMYRSQAYIEVSLA